jgi:hypothetical protein
VFGALVSAFSAEPRHVDLRWAQHAEQLDLRNGRFRDAVAQLAAPIHGVAKDELESEDVQCIPGGWRGPRWARWPC